MSHLTMNRQRKITRSIQRVFSGVWQTCQHVQLQRLSSYLLPHKQLKTSWIQFVTNSQNYALWFFCFNIPEMRLKWQPGNLMVTQRQGTNREKPLSNAWWKSVRRSRADHQSLNAPTCYRHPSSLRSLVSGKAVALLEISFYAHHNFLQIGVYIFSGDKY